MKNKIENTKHETFTNFAVFTVGDKFIRSLDAWESDSVPDEKISFDEYTDAIRDLILVDDIWSETHVTVYEQHYETYWMDTYWMDTVLLPKYTPKLHISKQDETYYKYNHMIRIEDAVEFYNKLLDTNEVKVLRIQEVQTTSFHVMG